MKSLYRSICSLLIVVLVIFSMPGEVSSQAATSILVSPAVATAASCATTEIAIRVENVTNLTGYSLQLAFTPGSLEVLEVVNGDFLDEGMYEPTNAFDNTTGIISFGMVQQNSIANPMMPKTGSGSLILIRLKAVTTGQTTPLVINPASSTLVNWPDAQSISFDITNGQVETRPCSPTNILLSNNVLDENQPVGAGVGTFSTSNPGAATSYTYTLIDSLNYPDNSFFAINANSLAAAQVLNYETSSSYTIKVRSTDAYGQYFDKVFTILVADLNDIPLLNPIGNQYALEGSQLSFTATATDEDLPVVPLTFSLSGSVPNGASITPAGVFTWTPTEAQGPAVHTFDVCVSDGVNPVCQTISVTVGEVNALPIAESQTVSTPEDTPVTILLAGSDVESPALIWAVVTQPAHGVLSGTAPNLTYTPADNYFGTDSFTFKVNDGTVDSNTATVSLTISPVNDAPLAVADAYTTPAGTSLVVAAPGLLANDSDIDGDSLTVLLASGANHGQLILNADGSFTYTPVSGYSGSDSFRYSARDGMASSEAVSVTITITKVTVEIYLPLILK